MKIIQQKQRFDLLFVVLLFAGSFWTLKLMQGASFFFDEWDFILKRGLNTEDLLRPHNGHFSFLPVLVFIALRRVFGLTSYLPYQIVGLAIHSMVCAGVYVIIRKRSQFVALFAGVLVCLLGSGWQNILWPFQIGMMGSLAAGLWALYFIDRIEIPRWRVSLLLGISLASAGGGVAVAAVVTLLLVLKKEWRAVVAISPTLLLYGIWYLSYGASQSQAGNLGETPQYIIDSALAAAAGIGNKSLIFGGFVIGGMVVLYFVKREETSLTSLQNGVVVLLLVTWSLTGFSRSHLGEPGASRYVYVGATCIVLLLCLLMPRPSNWQANAGVAAAAALLILPNMEMMRAGANGLLDTSKHLRAKQTAVENVRSSVKFDYSIDSARAPQMIAGEYFRAIDRFGSPAYSWKTLSDLDSVTLNGVNQTIADGSSVMQLTNDAGCQIKEPATKTQYEVAPQASLKLLIKNPTNLKLNWFQQSPDATYSLAISEVGVYTIRNPIERQSNLLLVSSDMQSVSVCDEAQP
jgi:hypothetical protein